MTTDIREKLVANRDRLAQLGVWNLEAMAEAAALAREAREAGVPIAEIARLLGFSRPTIYALTKP